MSKDPAFLLYSKDWLEGTADMLPHEKGVYIDLLCYQHQKGSLPNDELRLARLSGLGVDEFRKIWDVISKKFVEQNGVFVNIRLNTEIEKRAEHGHKKTILGHYALLIRKSKAPEKIIKKVKSAFKLDDFLPLETKEATSRLTIWFNHLVNQTENENENENKDNIEGGMGEGPKEVLFEEPTHPFQDFCKKLTEVSKLKKQLTPEECLELEKDFGFSIVEEVLLAMENHKDLTKKYKSVYLTCNNWCKRRISNPTKKGASSWLPN